MCKRLRQLLTNMTHGDKEEKPPARKRYRRCLYGRKCRLWAEWDPVKHRFVCKEGHERKA